MLVVWLLYDVICLILCIVWYVKNGTFDQTGYVSLLFGIHSSLSDYYKVYGCFVLIFCVVPKIYILIKGVPPNSVDFLLKWCGEALIIVAILIFIVGMFDEEVRTSACHMCILLLFVLIPLLPGILMLTSSLLYEQCTDQCRDPFMSRTSAVYIFCVLLSICGPLLFLTGMKGQGMYEIGLFCD